MRLTNDDTERAPALVKELRGLAAALPGGLHWPDGTAATTAGLLAIVRAMCDAAPFGIFLAGQRGECLYINPTTQKITGLSPEAAMGRGWVSALHPEDRERITSGWKSAVESGGSYRMSIHRFVHPNGEVRAVDVRALPLAGDTTENGFVGILEDVTERLAAEAERAALLVRAQDARVDAEAARAEVASILSRISDAFVALDREGRFTYANDRALALLGRSRAALIGLDIRALEPQPLGEAFAAAYRDAVDGQHTATATIRPPGQPRWHEVHIYPSPTGVSIFFEDVSDRRLREEQLATDRDYLRQELGAVDAFTEIVGLSPGLRTMMARVSMVAATNTNVLITGETGTGKELVARALHDASPRRDRLLVKVNCAAISAGLVESELFGHERGAFTGALQRRKGRFELAHGGTLFLDEVGELPLETQVKLLRVLQEREFERVGGSETIRVDVRVVAATNRNLPEMIRAGTFREDLFYRLNVFPVTLPPLRERADDIPLLAHTFLRRLARRTGRPVTTIAPRAMAALCAYHWPGNVRELENVIERGVVLAPGPLLDMDALPDLPTSPGHGAPPTSPVVIVPTLRPRPTTAAPASPTPLTIAELERSYVEEALAATGWVIEGERGAARRLGLHPNTLRSRLKRWGISRPANDRTDDRTDDLASA
jgi:formate hydrogenlyase transcriptional activator